MTLLVAGLTRSVCSGQAELEPAIRDVLANLPEDYPEDEDYSELYDRLLNRLRNPVDLNRTDGSDLSDLPFLTAKDIAAILDHRLATGNFLDVLELQAVEGLEPDRIKRLLPFVRIHLTPGGLTLHSWSHLRQEITLRFGRVFERQAGYRSASSTAYLGGPAKLQVRYKLALGDRLRTGFTLTKEAGERYSALFSRQLAVTALNLSWSSAGFLERIVAGSYSLQFGQGAALWSGMSLGKGTSILMVPRQGTGLRPVVSPSQTMGLSGLAATLHAGAFRFTPFLSAVKKAATREENAETGVEEITSISSTAYRRTQLEQTQADRLLQVNYGFTGALTRRRYEIGMLAMMTRFSHPIGRGAAVYEARDFKGDWLLNTAISYRVSRGNATWYGEAALSGRRSKALLHGAIVSFAPALAGVFLYRSYDASYTSFFNQALAESPGVAEEGLYSGLRFSPSKRLAVEAFTDRFRFPWLKYRVDAPSVGSETFASLSAQFSRAVQLKVFVRFRTRQENTDSSAVLAFPEFLRRRNFRADLVFSLTRTWTLRSRVEQIIYRKGAAAQEHGLLTYHDLLCDPQTGPLSGSVRFTVFRTDSYNSRIYAAENDVLYAYTNPAFQGAGSRFYINAKATINRRVTLWMRYARTMYFNRETVGSGRDESEGPVRSDARVQVRLVL